MLGGARSRKSLKKTIANVRSWGTNAACHQHVVGPVYFGNARTARMTHADETGAGWDEKGLVYCIGRVVEQDAHRVVLGATPVG
jgi:hypothetical protein